MTIAAPRRPAPDLAAIEQAALRSWPAFETEDIDGWLARWASGGSVRANSVAALAWTGGDVHVAISRVTDFYRRRGAVPRFTVAEVSMPADLDDVLSAAGWQKRGEHVTMAKDVRGGALPGDPVGGLSVEVADRPDTTWQAVYMQGLTPDRRGVALRLVEGVPGPRRFFAARRDGEIVASGLSVLDGELASVQCMATVPHARRTGAATAVLKAIEAWASGQGGRRLYLQTDAENTAAIGAYARYGFTVAGHYHTRDLVG